MDFLKPVFKTYHKRGEKTPNLLRISHLEKWQFGFELLLRDMLKSLKARRAEVGKAIEVKAQKENVLYRAELTTPVTTPVSKH